MKDKTRGGIFLTTVIEDNKSAACVRGVRKKSGRCEPFVVARLQNKIKTGNKKTEKKNGRPNEASFDESDVTGKSQLQCFTDT